MEREGLFSSSTQDAKKKNGVGKEIYENLQTSTRSPTPNEKRCGKKTTFGKSKQKKKDYTQDAHLESSRKSLSDDEIHRGESKKNRLTQRKTKKNASR